MDVDEIKKLGMIQDNPLVLKIVKSVPSFRFGPDFFIIRGISNIKVDRYVPNPIVRMASRRLDIFFAINSPPRIKWSHLWNQFGSIYSRQMSRHQSTKSKLGDWDAESFF